LRSYRSPRNSSPKESATRLALPTLAVVLYLALGVFIVVPFGEIRDLLFKRK